MRLKREVEDEGNERGEREGKGEGDEGKTEYGEKVKGIAVVRG